MCMITYLPEGIECPSEEIHNGGTWNTDGHGWAIAAATRVMVGARFMGLDQALSTFEIARKAFPDAPAVFHSRWATHGATNVSNVHPFPIGKYAVVAHNGILPPKFHPHGKDARSDTAILAANYMPGWSTMIGHWSRKSRKRIGRIIGTGNKLAILSVSPALDRPMGYLVNGSAGHWDSTTGAWFSNHDYQYEWTPKYRKVTGWAMVDDYKSTNATMECGVCFAYDVDPMTRICRSCLSCMDCAEHVADCDCHVTRSALKAIEAGKGELEA